LSGSGFGLMSILVGIERGFITRTEGIDRLKTIINFLANDADRFRGVWSHWLSGTTGDVIPFSPDDDGGDLVETSLLVQGLLTVRQYLEETNTEEALLIETINTIWEEVEWDWHVQENTNYLTWHWSPNFNFQKNLRIGGWNESLITYVLAAASPTHPISKQVYDEGWARNGAMQNGNVFYDIQLPLGPTLGGPLFFSHYSFLGIDPSNLSDAYASSYFTQNQAHSLINRAYCIDNPLDYVGYSSSIWGLTASDGNQGYSAHSPTNDRGVITPTAAISSLPYTPEESMAAIRHFYYILGDKLWGPYGFYDAFNVTEGWYADSYLAIDQGPIVCMIENYRTGLLWDLFMSAPEVQSGLDQLGFTY
ncbi:MAG: glucoamylase family protein, partial [Bacteroidota bacterium]